MKTMTILAAVATMALSACAQKELDLSEIAVRNGPQTQSPIADAPFGKLPEAGVAIGGSVAIPVIIDDSGVTAAPAGGSIFEAL